MSQTMTSGTGNIQTINYANSAQGMNDASQSFTGVGITLEKSMITPVGNIQAVNFAQAASYSGQISQTVTVDSLVYEN